MPIPSEVEGHRLWRQAVDILNSPNAQARAGEARTLAERGLVLLRLPPGRGEDGTQGILADCLGSAAVACSYLGDINQAVTYGLEAIELYDRLGLKPQAVMARTSVANDLRKLGRADEARRLLSDANVTLDGMFSSLDQQRAVASRSRRPAEPVPDASALCTACGTVTAVGSGVMACHNCGRRLPSLKRELLGRLMLLVLLFVAGRSLVGGSLNVQVSPEAVSAFIASAVLGQLLETAALIRSRVSTMKRVLTFEYAALATVLYFFPAAYVPPTFVKVAFFGGYLASSLVSIAVFTTILRRRAV